MNPNWQVTPLNYNDLELKTKYRFAEVEISRAIPILIALEDRRGYTIYNNIASRLYRRIQQNTYYPEREQEFIEVAFSQPFRNPQKKEIGIMLRYRNVSYKNIRQITSMSPNTISNLHIASPFFNPIYSHWDEDMLASWDDIKGGLNLWSETLHHMK